MPATRIFVSHSHLDSVFTKRLVADLQAKLGVEAVWMDEHGGLHPGDEWWRKIVTEITDRDTFLVVLTLHALTSDWVPREMGIAYFQHVKAGKQLRPVLLEPCQIPADWELIQAIDFTGGTATYTMKLEELLATVIDGRGGSPSPLLVDQRPPAVVRLVREVQAAFGLQDWRGVEDKTDVLAQIAPTAFTAALWQERGLALQALGQFGQALEALERALSLDPHDVPTLQAKSAVQIALNQTGPAWQTLTLAYRLTTYEDLPQRLRVLSELVEALVRDKQWDEAARRAEEGLRLAPGNAEWQQRRLHAHLAPLQAQYDAAMQRQDWDAALHACTAALGLAPHDAAWTQRQAQATAASAEAARARQLAELRARYDAAMQGQQWDVAQAAASEALRLAAGDAEWQRRQTQAAAAKVEAERKAREEAERLRRAAEATLTQYLTPRLRQLNFQGRATATGVAVITPPLATVPAGPFWMGSENDPQASKDEYRHQVTLDTYQIALYPLTVAEWACALAAKAAKVSQPSDWSSQLTRLDHPVMNISWNDAQAYVTWLGQVTGEGWRLPTEAEWEKVARWDERTKAARIYPWGDRWEKARANTSDGGPGRTTAIGEYAGRNDASPYGCHDMAGNVWEWCSSLYFDEPYQRDDRHENINDHTNARVLRGGSWDLDPQLARAASRNDVLPEVLADDGGFRVGRAGRAG